MKRQLPDVVHSSKPVQPLAVRNPPIAEMVRDGHACLAVARPSYVGADEDASGAILVKNVGDVRRPGAHGITGEELRRICRQLCDSISIDLGRSMVLPEAYGVRPKAC